MKVRSSHAHEPLHLQIAYTLIWVSIALLVVLTVVSHLANVDITQLSLFIKGARILLIGSIVVTIWRRYKALSAIGILMMVVVMIQ